MVSNGGGESVGGGWEGSRHAEDLDERGDVGSNVFSGGEFLISPWVAGTASCCW